MGAEHALFDRLVLQLAFAVVLEAVPAAVTELFATCYGPTVATLRATDPDGASRLRDELTRLFEQHNLVTDGTTAVAGEYLDVQARVA